MKILSFLFMTGCVNNILKNGDEFPDNPLHDNDGDGLTEQDGDCDDRNSEVEGPSTWYIDADGDGFGDANASVESCEPEVGYVSNGDDCLDSDATIFPGNAQYESEALCVVDGDGDGYGDAIPSVSADSGSDCDDTDASVYPGYNEEAGNLCILDADNDGFGQMNAPQPYDSGSDCDDSTADVQPDRAEICDGIDNDCNGEIDDYSGSNAPRWYNDDDGDGYGNIELFINACTQPPSFVADSTDCDDTNSDAFPNALEYCDGVDTNCNGIEDDSIAQDALIWFQDGDSDGFGSSVSQTACLQPSGYVGETGDCNDNNAAIYPNADEYCNSVDDDCDGSIDEDSAVDALLLYPDNDGDGYGLNFVASFSCSVQSGTVLDNTDCDDTSSDVRPGAPEFCNGRDDDCDGDLDEEAVDASIFYVDDDGDGHGTTAQTLLGCSTLVNGMPTAPAGYSFFDDDCDDSNSSRAPSLPELCTDTVDENCDGDTTIGATDITVYYADSDMDGQGSPLYTVSVCSAPFGYVTNSDDCNDTDANVLSGMAEDWEVCNGKLDRCEDDDGILTPSDQELDDDGDGYVDCVLDVDPLQWADLSAGIVGGGDCEDDDIDAYPGATEKCNGVVENFAGDGLCSAVVPVNELDDDGDGFVECEGFEATSWEGDVTVIGGDDCNDTMDFIYPGAASNQPGVCAQDLDANGESDCRLTGIHPEYVCDPDGIVSAEGLPDFVLIPAGSDPLGRYSISSDFYMMTTEVTVNMWDAVMGSGGSGSIMGKHDVNWNDAALFANALSTLMGKEECYQCTSSLGTTVCSDGIDPTVCEGYRLATEAEWEYAARSGTTMNFWTGDGPDLGGDYSSSGCTGTETIEDGVNSPLLSDYAWYCANDTGFNEVAQKLPNGFGLYDMHGNLKEWVSDYYNVSFPSGFIDPWDSDPTSNRGLRGGAYHNLPGNLKSSLRGGGDPNATAYGYGIRLVILAP